MSIKKQDTILYSLVLVPEWRSYFTKLHPCVNGCGISEIFKLIKFSALNYVRLHESGTPANEWRVPHEITHFLLSYLLGRGVLLNKRQQEVCGFSRSSSGVRASCSLKLIYNTHPREAQNKGSVIIVECIHKDDILWKGEKTAKQCCMLGGHFLPTPNNDLTG